MSRHASYCVALVAAIAIASAVASIAAQQNPYPRSLESHRHRRDGGIYWLEIKDEGGQLTGMFLNRGGSPVKLATVKVENGELFFQSDAARTRRRRARVSRAGMQGDKLTGTMKTADSHD